MLGSECWVFLSWIESEHRVPTNWFLEEGGTLLLDNPCGQINS